MELYMLSKVRVTAEASALTGLVAAFARAVTGPVLLNKLTEMIEIIAISTATAVIMIVFLVNKAFIAEPFRTPSASCAVCTAAIPTPKLSVVSVFYAQLSTLKDVIPLRCSTVLLCGR